MLILFVLDARPMVRVAHLHIVSEGSPQWTNYLGLRDLLRSDELTRQQYLATKRALAERIGNDRTAYTAGKDAVIADLLSQIGLHPSA